MSTRRRMRFDWPPKNRAAWAVAILAVVVFGFVNVGGPKLVVVETMYGAISANDKTLVSVLLDAGVDPNVRSGASGITPLLGASALGNRETVALLVSRGADLEKVDSLGKTPLMAAAGSGHTEVVRLLLQAGADPKRRSRRGLTASDYASTDEVARLIRSRGDG